MAEAPGKADNFQPFGLEFREAPSDFYEDLLARSPLPTEVGGEPAVVISRHAQVRQVLTYHKDFSSVKPSGVPNMERVDFFNSRPVMNYSDPPHHTQLRKIVNPAFTPRNLDRLRARGLDIATTLLDGFGDAAEFDAVEDFGYPFSKSLLMNEFMGVPGDEEHIFLDWLHAIPLLDAIKPGEGKPKGFLDAWAAGVEYCKMALERARRENSDNLVRLIAEASDDGRITEEDVMATMLVLFAGGLTTVSATMGSALLKLTEFPAAAERLRQEPELAGRFFEETLRLNPALISVMRFPKTDMTFEGLDIAAETPLYVMLSAACHDPRQFPEPFRFDMDRTNNREHMAFGAGHHTCIGNVIARAVVPPVIAEVARRYPKLHRSRPQDALRFDVANPRVRHLASVRVAA